MLFCIAVAGGIGSHRDRSGLHAGTHSTHLVGTARYGSFACGRASLVLALVNAGQIPTTTSKNACWYLRPSTSARGTRPTDRRGAATSLAAIPTYIRLVSRGSQLRSWRPAPPERSLPTPPVPASGPATRFRGVKFFDLSAPCVGVNGSRLSFWATGVCEDSLRSTEPRRAMRDAREQLRRGQGQRCTALTAETVGGIVGLSSRTQRAWRFSTSRPARPVRANTP